MVIWPTVEVVMVMLLPLIKVIGAYLVPVLSAPSNCPCWVGRVEVPVPPLATPNTPETSLVKEARPLNKAPAEVERTRPVVKEETVVEPLVVTEKMEVLAPFLMSKTAKVEAAAEVA